MNALRTLKLSKYLVNKKTRSPLYLIHFVTTACNAKCAHCFVDNLRETKDNLTLQEIEKITKSFSRDIFNVNLTGGEPFLRDDIPEIAGLYASNAGVSSILIASNGSLPEKILKDTKKILDENKGIRLTISLSVDHIGEKHDKIRGINGLYNSVIKLYHELDPIDPARLSVQVNLTLQRDNHEDVESIIEHLVRKEGIRNLNLSIVREGSRDKDTLSIKKENYKKGSELLKKYLLSGRLSGFGNRYLSVLDSKNIVSRQVIEKILSEQKFVSPCYAGSLTAVLTSNGDVYPCEMRNKKIGNIRDHAYNFSSLWVSDQAKSLRREIKKSKCFCTHECNWTTNILFNLLYVPRIVSTFFALLSKHNKER